MKSDGESKILLLYNSFSGKGKGKEMAQDLKQMLISNAIDFEAFENEWPIDMEGFKEVWIIGGDGTLNYFLNHYKEIKIPIAIFPGGTGNDFHWKFYGNIEFNVHMEKILNGKIRKVDLGICNGERFVNTIGLGFDGEVLKEMKTVRYIGGHLGYLLIVIKKIFTYKEKTYTVELNGSEFETKSLLFLVSNSSRTGGGFMVSPLAEIDDGLLNVVYSKSLSLMQRLMLLPKVEKGKHLGDKNISHVLCKEISIRCEEEIYYQLDGELRKGKEFEVFVVKAALEVKGY